MRVGLDIGSSSAKAILVDGRGRAGRAARRTFPTRRDRGRVEHDAARVFAATLGALEDLAPSLPARAAIPLGFASQRSTFLFWDRATGRPLTPAISWQDLRAAALNRAARGRGARHGIDIGLITGLRPSAHYAAPKISWALRRVPGLRRRVAAGQALWGTLTTYVVWRLTHGAVYAVDHANAQRTSLMDVATLSWEPRLFDLYGLEPLLDAPALPALTPTCLSSPIEFAAGGRRLALQAVTGDQQAALVGLRCRRRGDMAINYGSGAFVLRCIGTGPIRRPGLLTTLVSSRWMLPPADGREGGMAATFALEGPVNAAAIALDWVAARMHREVHTADLDRLCGPWDPAAPRDLHFLPAISGLAAPHWDERAKPTFVGSLAAAGLAERMRAAVEAIAQRCAEIALAAGAAAPDSGRGGARAPVRVSGGLTRCRYLLQAQADLLGRSVAVTETRDATGVGAALLAAPIPAGRDRGGHGGETLIAPIASAAQGAVLRDDWSRAVYRGAVDPSS
ncbi:MAG TPA: FGGY family carbohydrate kinase [Candidatus Polarisedimenticolia bacterium]|nr:FGGY family carbohydrate kinase [Candidatus Polarisedimenticolia bacterium]